MKHSLLEALGAKDNNYSALESQFFQNTKHELSRRALDFLPSQAYSSCSVSVIIPCWNSASTLRRTLYSLAHSHFVRRHPDLFQVIVVDDGSNDNLILAIDNLSLPFEVALVRQSRAGRAVAMNTGFAFATGDILINCDADMVISPWAIGELVSRVSLCSNAVYGGFRREMKPTDPRISEAAIKAMVPAETVESWFDSRMFYHWEGHRYPGLPRSVVATSEKFKSLGNGKVVYLPDGDFSSLPQNIHGCLFAISRNRFEAIGGYDERFIGWGFEDTFVMLKAVASGMYIIPVPTASGIHISHRIRSPRQWEQGRKNRRLLNELAQTEDLPPCESSWVKRAKCRALEVVTFPGSSSALFNSGVEGTLRSLDALKCDPLWQLRSFTGLGEWESALPLAQNVEDGRILEGAQDIAETFRRLSRIDLLEDLIARHDPCPPIIGLEYARALLAAGYTAKAFVIIAKLHRSGAKDQELSYFFRGAPTKYFRRAVRNTQRGLAQALEDDLLNLALSGGEGCEPTSHLQKVQKSNSMADLTL